MLYQEYRKMLNLQSKLIYLIFFNLKWKSFSNYTNLLFLTEIKYSLRSLYLFIFYFIQELLKKLSLPKVSRSSREKSWKEISPVVNLIYLQKLYRNRFHDFYLSGIKRCAIQCFVIPHELILMLGIIHSKRKIFLAFNQYSFS